MLPLPKWPFKPEQVSFCPASRRSLVKLQGAYYSVPCEWAGLDLPVHLGAFQVEIVGPDGQTRVHHPRLAAGLSSIDYRHYLRELRTKPQAVRQVAHELCAQLGDPFGRVWRRLVDERGPKDAARAFAKIIGAIVELGHDAVVEKLIIGLQGVEPILWAVQVRRGDAANLLVDDGQLPSVLQGIEVQSARAADFDALLAGGDR
jgi:hypothetical protein